MRPLESELYFDAFAFDVSGAPSSFCEGGAFVQNREPKSRKPALRRAFEGRKFPANARMAAEPFPRPQSSVRCKGSQAGKPKSVAM